MKQMMQKLKTLQFPRFYLIPAGAVILAAILMLVLLPGKSAAPIPTVPEVTAPVIQENLYGPEDFQFEGDYMTCISGESLLGIDVSHHQAHIDWQQVAASGIRFAMIRVGYRGIETAELYMDDRAVENLQGALAAGLQVGVYFFSQAITPEEAVEEAEYTLDIIKINLT